jgi:DNA replication ATP-dependent helicase Dna2
MIQAIYKELPDALKAITIDTVERFQGSERQNIIISLPLHNVSDLNLTEALSGDGKIDRKLNVAITRAQQHLIILGCSKLCQQSRHYNNLLHKIQSYGTMINYDELS